jgi:hypothetical protein
MFRLTYSFRSCLYWPNAAGRISGNRSYPPRKIWLIYSQWTRLLWCNHVRYFLLLVFLNERNDLVVSGSANLIVKNAETTTTVCVVGNFRETCNGSRCGTNRYLPNSCCAVTSDRLTEVKTWRFFNVLFWKLAISNANPSLTTVSGGIIWKKKKKKRTRHTTDEASSLLEQGRIKNRPCLVYYRYIHCGIACQPLA